jgi:probable O-glycosylation ligase (exosortase A-associated)
MRDLALFLILVGLGALAWWRPWLGVLGLAFLGGMAPQAYAQGFMSQFPVFMVLFVVTALGALRDWVRGLSRPSLRFAWLRGLAPPHLAFDWRMALLLALWAWFYVTTTQALNPWAAWPKLWEVFKLLPPLLLSWWLIDSREKLLALNIAMALAVALVVLKGGYWAVMTGFQDRVYGPPGSQYGDNNEFAVLTAMSIPMLMLWYREITHPGARMALAGLIALSFVSTLSSWSRGGLLSLGVVTVLLVWHSRRKWLALPLLALGVGLMFVNLPEAWFARMGALGGGEFDASAQSRLVVWKLGWAHALERPWFGGGFQGWIYLSQPTGGLLDWHSAYVEMAAEHGLVGLALWSALLLGNMVALTWLIWRGRRLHLVWLENHAAMLRASLAAYLVGAAFLGIAYWQMLYLLLVSAVLLQGFAARATPSMPLSQPEREA